FARLFGLRGFDEVGWLSARGIRFEGQLSAILVLYETRKIFGTRTSERFGPTVALFELAMVRFLEHDARAEAVETLDGVTQLVDGLLSLVGDDMHAQRCSLMLRAREDGWLYLAAARGLAPGVAEGARIRIGDGVAGRVAASREPLLVRDVSEAKQHPLLRDQY